MLIAVLQSWERPIWKLALRLAKRMLPAIAEPSLLNQSVALAMYLLPAVRESGSAHDLMLNDEFAELIAVPLQLPLVVQIDVIQFHPMLHPRNIDTIREWIACNAGGTRQCSV